MSENRTSPKRAEQLNTLRYNRHRRGTKPSKVKPAKKKPEPKVEDWDEK